MACAKVWEHEGAPGGSGGLWIGFQKGMTQRDARQVRSRPRSGVRAVESHGRVLNKGSITEFWN